MEILIISGLSGAGKSRAASFLEDMGFYIVDNMPAAMILKFAEFCAGGSRRYDRVALVYDVRTANSPTELFAVLDSLKHSSSVCSLLFLEASPETILKRYKETRRVHPLGEECASLEQAIQMERKVLAPLRERADWIVDTTGLTLGQLRSKLLSLFSKGTEEGKMEVHVLSFGFKHGVPMEADLVFDVRFLPNPYYVPELRGLTGLDEGVRDYVFSNPQSDEFLKRLSDFVSYLLPRYAEEGKTSLTIAVGCTGGHHRSVAVAHALAQFVAGQGFPVTESHRDMGRN